MNKIYTADFLLKVQKNNKKSQNLPPYYVRPILEGFTIRVSTPSNPRDKVRYSDLDTMTYGGKVYKLLC